ncbi:hypothetical protein QNO07_11440 [Streptomyces sp. 549]|uniref:hypothetical protein n=1 Tax=Streptomyces sp. 549 TaxID=3049076 RepID=UPI0024C46137|nr:hypothetical protein [Streptomyces sp. 549]MDK1474022.1 hypothetical protein [Streptomyces sp. 549]
MTACAMETPADSGGTRESGRCTISADGSYAARLTTSGSGCWYPERWTLDGPEPYAVALAGHQPEEADSEVQPLADGRVVLVRRTGQLYRPVLLYPTGGGTGEVPLGALECEQLSLLPPAPDGLSCFALVRGPLSTTVWLLAGGAFGPEPVAEVPGRCSGGGWLDREGRLLALDREDAHGQVKTVAVDLGRGGAVNPLLEITEESNDRLLLADPDSGLLLLRSDAPGTDRVGWGVLGSRLPVRFPEALHPSDVSVTPFAVQPGQVLTPECCAVALRVDGPNGTWAAVWRPGDRDLRHLSAPPGWLPGTGLVTPGGELRLPHSTPTAPCGLARVAPLDDSAACSAGPAPATFGAFPGPQSPTGEPAGSPVGDGAGPPAGSSAGAEPLPSAAAVCRPVPLQQAPLAGRY